MASNIMDSQTISKMLPYGEAFVLIGLLGPKILAAYIYKKFFFIGYMASNINDSQNISKTFPYVEVLVLIGQLAIRA